jgi:hypothetical protein
MPNQPNVGDTLQIRIVTYTTTQIGVNVLHYYVTAVSGTTPDLTTIASAFEASLYTYYKATMAAANASWRGVSCKDLTPLQTLALPFVGHAGPGTAGGSGAPTQTAGLITFRTQYGGAANRGRMYLPFPAAGMVDAAGAPQAGYLTQLTLIAAALGPNLLVTGGAGTASMTQVIRRRGHPMYQDPFVFAYTVQNKFATQRRRGQYGRVNILPF